MLYVDINHVGRIGYYVGISGPRSIIIASVLSALGKQVKGFHVYHRIVNLLYVTTAGRRMISIPRVFLKYADRSSTTTTSNEVD